MYFAKCSLASCFFDLHVYTLGDFNYNISLLQKMTNSNCASASGESVSEPSRSVSNHVKDIFYRLL